MASIEKAFWSFGNYQTMVAEAAITAGQVVQLGTAGKQVKPTDGTNEIVVGIAYGNAAIGEEVVIATPYPIVPAVAGGAVTRGKFVMPQVGGGLEGRVVEFDLNWDGANEVGCLGLALDAATNGQLCPVLMCGSAVKASRT